MDDEVRIPFAPVRVRPSIRVMATAALLLFGLLVVAVAVLRVGRDPRALPVLAACSLMLASIGLAALLRRSGSITVRLKEKRLVFRYFPDIGLLPLPRVHVLNIEGVSGVGVESRGTAHRIVLQYATGAAQPLLPQFTYDRGRQEHVAAELRRVLPCSS